MAKYKHTTLEQLRNIISTSLGETEMVFWPKSEIDSLIEESLLTFGAFSGFNKEEIFIPTESKKQVYNIFTDSLAVDKLKIAPTLTFEKLVSWIRRDLIIPDYSSDEILKLAIVKYNEFQLRTSLVLSTKSLEVVAEDNKLSLGDNVADIVRASFVDLTSTENPQPTYTLRKVDEVELNNFDADVLVEPGIPNYYTNSYNFPNEINLYPIPINTGRLDLIFTFVHSLEDLVTTIINLPNNLVPYLKYGILSEIFTKAGVHNDPGRAAYCVSRWEEGIVVGKNYSVILKTTSDGLAIENDSLFNLDLFSDYKISRNAPTILGLAGINIFGLDIIPDTLIHSIGITGNMNMLIPIATNDYIDIAKEYINLIRDYVVHLGQIKCGIAEIAQTSGARKAMLALGVAFNSRLKNKSKTFEVISKISQREEKEQPRLVEI